MGVVVVFRRPLSCGSIPRVGQTVKRDLGGKLSATSSGKRSVFEPLPGATILVTVRAFGFQTLGAAPAEKLPVLEPIGATPIQSRRHGRAGITGFGTFSHSLTETQARLTSVIRGTTSDWINPRDRVAAAEYSLTQSKAAARHRCAAITAHPDRQNRRLGPPPRRAPSLMTSPAYCPP